MGLSSPMEKGVAANRIAEQTCNLIPILGSPAGEKRNDSIMLVHVATHPPSLIPLSAVQTVQLLIARGPRALELSARLLTLIGTAESPPDSLSVWV